MEKINQHIKSIQFKKRLIGGVDEESVLVEIKNLCNLFWQEMSAMVPAEEMQNLRKENQRLREENEGLRSQIDHNTKGDHEEYNRKLKELDSELEAIQSVKKSAAVRAQMEAIKEAAAMRSEIIEKTNRDRQAAEEEISKLQDEVVQLEEKRKSIHNAMQDNAHRLKLLLYQIIEDVEQGMSWEKAPSKPRVEEGGTMEILYGTGGDKMEPTPLQKHESHVG